MKRRRKDTGRQLGLQPPNSIAPPTRPRITPAAFIKTRWVAYACWKNSSPDPITLFQATWAVPPAPVGNPPSSFFLFNGLQVTDPTEPNNPGNRIIQPVLQWDGSKGGWSVALWNAGAPGAGGTAELEQAIEEKTVLTGRITKTDNGLANCSYLCEFLTGAPPNLKPLSAHTFNGLPLLTSCVMVLEAININQSADYPYGPDGQTPVIFSNLRVQTGSGNVAQLKWVERIHPTPGIGENCGFPQSGNFNIGFRS